MSIPAPAMIPCARLRGVLRGTDILAHARHQLRVVEQSDYRQQLA